MEIVKQEKIKMINNIKGDHFRVLCFSLFALFFSCASSGKEDANDGSWYVTVRGKVGFPQEGRITIQEIREGSMGVADTITLKANYTFLKKVKVKEPGYYRINFYNRQMVDLILYKSDLEVNVDGNNSNGFAEIKGSPEIDVIRKTQAMMQETDQLPEVAKLNEDFAKANELGDRAKMAELQQAYMVIAGRTRDKVAQFLKDQGPSLGVINLLQSNTLDREQYYDTYVAVADKLRKEWPTYTHAQALIAMVDKMAALAIGKVAPEISLPDTQGQIVKLSSLRGKYVLVDFWAKWCGPCRQENPNVVRAYNAFKDKGFTVYGVSLDRSKDDWVRAIQEDGLTWTQVSDLKYWQSEAARIYNITAIPFSLLLDKNGVIIAKNLRGAALEAKLNEIFSAKGK